MLRWIARDGYSGILIRISRNSHGGLDRASSGVIYPCSYSIVTSILRERKLLYSSRDKVARTGEEWNFPFLIETPVIFTARLAAPSFCFDATRSLFPAVYANDNVIRSVTTGWLPLFPSAKEIRENVSSAGANERLQFRRWDGGRNLCAGISGLREHCVTYGLGLRNS